MVRFVEEGELLRNGINILRGQKARLGAPGDTDFMLPIIFIMIGRFVFRTPKIIKHVRYGRPDRYTIEHFPCLVIQTII